MTTEFKLIKNVEDLEGAEMGDMLYTYNQLTGGNVKRFSDRAVAKRRCEMAIMAAKDADAKTGVPKGAEGEVKTRVEIEAKAEQRGMEAPPALEERPVFPPGSLAAQLAKAGEQAKPIERRPTKKEQNNAGDAAPKKKALFAVMATFAGKSKPQAGSVRNSVLLRIQNAPKSAALVKDLDEHFQQDTRGYIQKLLEKEHLVLIDDQDALDKLPDTHPNKPKADAQA